MNDGRDAMGMVEESMTTTGDAALDPGEAGAAVGTETTWPEIVTGAAPGASVRVPPITTAGAAALLLPLPLPLPLLPLPPLPEFGDGITTLTPALERAGLEETMEGRFARGIVEESMTITGAGAAAPEFDPEFDPGDAGA